MFNFYFGRQTLTQRHWIWNIWTPNNHRASICLWGNARVSKPSVYLSNCNCACSSKYLRKYLLLQIFTQISAPPNIYANIGTSNLRKYLGNNCRKSNWNCASVPAPNLEILKYWHCFFFCPEKKVTFILISYLIRILLWCEGQLRNCVLLS